MLLNNDESGWTKPMDGLESFCRVEGVDYPYAKSCMEDRCGRKSVNKKEGVAADNKMFRFLLLVKSFNKA